MKNESYYRILTDTDNNFRDESGYLTVNCAGHSYYSNELSARSVRKDFYLFYLISGKIEIKRPSNCGVLSGGEMMIFPPDNEFEYTMVSGETVEYYWVHFTGHSAREIISKCGLTVGAKNCIGVNEHLCDNFRKVFEAFLKKDDLWQCDCAARLNALLVRAGRCKAGNSSTMPKDSSKIKTALSIIHDNISSPVRISDLAAAEHLSVSRFRFVFKALSGLSPNDYITLTKLNYSCELLRQTDHTVKQIAAACGYYDEKYYCRLFKKRFGITPGGYRSENRS